MGVNEVQVCSDALDRGDWDVFILAGRYTLLEQDLATSLFEKCAQMGSDIVIGGPFNSSVLAGGDSFDYVAISLKVGARVQALQRVFDAHTVPMPAAALQFPFAHPIVKSVIPGPRIPTELDQNVEWWNHKIPKAFWDDLRRENLIHSQAPTPA